MLDRLFTYSEEEMKDLVLRLYPRIIRYIQKIVRGSVVEAEDILSNILTKILEKKPAILKDKVEGYIFRAVRNECLNIISRKTVERNMVSIDSITVAAWEVLAVVDMDDAVSEIDDIPTVELDEILKFSESFSPRTRDIFQMSRVEGMTQAEIADKLGITVRAVQKHLKTTVDEYRKYYREKADKLS